MGRKHLLFNRGQSWFFLASPYTTWSLVRSLYFDHTVAKKNKCGSFPSFLSAMKLEQNVNYFLSLHCFSDLFVYRKLASRWQRKSTGVARDPTDDTFMERKKCNPQITFLTNGIKKHPNSLFKERKEAKQRYFHCSTNFSSSKILYFMRYIIIYVPANKVSCCYFWRSF